MTLRVSLLGLCLLALVSVESCKRDNPVTPTPPPTPPTPEIEPEAGSTVYGLVSCNGEAIPNAVISDGYEVVKTDSKGIYQMKSSKKNPYVFISIPSGYTVASSGVIPLLHKTLTKAATTPERVDFTLLKDGDQTNHTMLFFGDIHLAKQNNDQEQFKIFTSEINSYIKMHPSEKVYAMTLGDMTWDQYWYSHSYCFAEYLKEVNAVKNLLIFHTIGNHDHDMKAAGDWFTVAKFKNQMCPNYYSFNIGKIHYVVIDDIECQNTGEGTVASRHYTCRIVNDDLVWLKKDLQYVSKETPVVITMHSPVYSKVGSDYLKNVADITSVVSGYKVTFVTGHTHDVYSNFKGDITEYNNGAVCAAWWFSGKYNPTFNVARDGAPGGYRLATVRGKEFKSIFKAIGRDASYQFRAYDRNSIKINTADYGLPSDKESLLFEEDYGSYRTSKTDNIVLINVWDYDSRWKVEASENGKSMVVTHLGKSYDPTFLISYTIPRLKENGDLQFHQTPVYHLFSVKASSAKSTVTIKVTDDEGNVYIQTMKRPLPFTVDTYK